MSALVVDTSSWIEYFRGQAGYTLIERCLEDGTLHLPLAVAGELLSARLTKRRRADLEELLKELPILGDTYEHWRQAGKLRDHLAGKGLVVSMIDTHVAQCALEQDGFLLTEDAIFKKMTNHVSLNLAPR